ncbi:MAG TPA: ISAs1 family transposase [Gemmataceae bacterium]|jgi:predicted transposase YbfD/YdcC|nr:ISAs1 family transposase [Gemmataceae bacterium]
MATSSLSIKKHFVLLRDPRRRHRRLHRLLDIIVIAICAVVADCDSWTDIAAFGRRRQGWLKRFLALPHGIPSHDTFERVFGLIDPQAFQACFRQWMLALAEALGVKQIAIDGKTLCGSGAPSAHLGPLHLVSAWATKNHISLGQVAVDAKSNEITAIPALLELLDLHGALVTIDAMGCQKEIAAKIREGGNHYVLTVKDNQPNLLADIQACMEQALDTDFAGLDYDTYETEEQGHGRQERRSYTIIRDPEGIRDRDAWRDLHVIGMCYSRRTRQGKTSEEVRYFIGSKRAGARYYGKALRGHWGIENSLHWQLDVSFHEDADRTQERNAAQNMGLLRRLAVTLLKREPSKGSIACKRKQAGWDTNLLEAVLRTSANLESQ